VNPLVSAIQQIRKRLGLSQADLATRLGSQQNAVSKYQSGKVHPGKDVLIKLWEIADAAERRLITAYLYEQFSFLSQPEKSLLLDSALSLNLQRRHFSVEIAEALNRPEAPAFLREIVSLYLKFRKHPETQRTFEQALAWLRVQFQMLDYAEKVGSAIDTSSGKPDPVGMELREAASKSLPQRPDKSTRKRVKP
jgi:transcriptional regulator with XRE-family HTH domain